jgi:hypothetical protein
MIDQLISPIVEQLSKLITEWIEWPYLCMFILLTYQFRDILRNTLAYRFGFNIKRRYVVFIIATFMAIGYWFIHVCFFPEYDAAESRGKLLVKLFFTYTTGTALHKIIIEWLVNAIGNFRRSKRQERKVQNQLKDREEAV